MAKKAIVFDLETIADPAAVQYLPEPEPDSRLKDPVKIEASIADKKAKQVAEMGLNPATSLICCFGWATEDKAGHIMLEDENSEKDLLLKVWELLSDYDHFVTFNGNNFDVPTLLMHSLKNRVRPSIRISTKRYQIDNHTDVRAVLTGWNNTAKGTFDFFSKILLGETPKDEMSGDQVQGYWDMDLKDDIARYCKKDCRATWMLYDLIENYWNI